MNNLILKKFLSGFMIILNLFNYSPIDNIERDPLVLAFENTNTNFNNFTISAYDSYDGNFYSEEELKIISNELASNLNLKDINIAIEDIEYENYNSIITTGYIDESALFEITLQSFCYDDIPYTYIFVIVTETKDYNKFSYLKNIVKNMMENYTMYPEINYCFTGTIDGYFDGNLENILKNVYDIIEMKCIDSNVFISNSSNSFYGYSPLIEDYITDGDKKININFATKYNENKNLTYLFMGSPIISMDY